ncbi:unnamed protein product [marine sediment metagenome]|uniref:Uncharacterized protein n=1 Tax=marine sediment metagenome TaxID=412755 RepID=X1D518_9ZZZZ
MVVLIIWFILIMLYAVIRAIIDRIIIYKEFGKWMKLKWF